MFDSSCACESKERGAGGSSLEFEFFFSTKTSKVGKMSSLTHFLLSRASALLLSFFLSLPFSRPPEHGTMMLRAAMLPAAARMPAAPLSTRGGGVSSSSSLSSPMMPPLSAAAATTNAKPSSPRRNRNVAARAVEIAPEKVAQVRVTHFSSRPRGKEPLPRGAKCPRDRA